MTPGRRGPIWAAVTRRRASSDWFGWPSARLALWRFRSIVDLASLNAQVGGFTSVAVLVAPRRTRGPGPATAGPGPLCCSEYDITPWVALWQPTESDSSKQSSPTQKEDPTW